MPTTLKWALSANVLGGPSFAPAGQINLDAYEVIDVTVDATKKGTITLDADAATKISTVIMMSSSYDGTKLKYKFAGGTARAFDAPLVLIGPSAVALLGASLPASVEIDNSAVGSTSVRITILIGRSAVTIA